MSKQPMVPPQDGEVAMPAKGARKRQVKYRARVAIIDMNGQGRYKFIWREPRSERCGGAKSATLVRQYSASFCHSSSANEWAALKVAHLSRKFAGTVFNQDVHP